MYPETWTLVVSDILIQASRQPQRRDGRCTLPSYGRAVNGSSLAWGSNRNASMPNLGLYIHENLSIAQSLQQCNTPSGSERGLSPSEGDSKEAPSGPSEPKGTAETPLHEKEPLPNTVCSNEPPKRETLPAKPPKRSSTKARPWAFWFHQRQKEGSADSAKSILDKSDERLKKARAKEKEKSRNQNRLRRQFPLRE